jgi:hypothetical protein
MALLAVESDSVYSGWRTCQPGHGAG